MRIVAGSCSGMGEFIWGEEAEIEAAGEAWFMLWR